MTGFWTVSIFWIVVAVALAVALAFVLPPLLGAGKGGGVDAASANAAIRRQQMAELEADLRAGTLGADQYADARRDLEAELLREMPAPGVATGGGRWAGFALAGIVPVAAVALYLVLGSPQHLLSAPATAAAPASMPHDAEAMVSALEEKLKQHVNDGAGWAMLGRSYVALGRSQEGARAFARAAELIPGDARLLADYAEALALTQNGNMGGAPDNLIARALAIDANDTKALMLAGVAANQEQDYAQAASYWRRALELTPGNSELAGQLAAAIDNAEAAGKLPHRAPAAEPVAADGKSIAGTVAISPQLAGKVSPADSVFIFAQAPQGPPMPLAVQRITVGQLPYRFTLDDSMSMAAGNRLSDHASVTVTARVSKSGRAVPQSGDLQGRTGPVRLGQDQVALTIDSVVP